MTISEKSAYLKGLMDGLSLNTEANEGKMIAAIVDLLGDLTKKVTDIEDTTIAISDELDEIEEELEASEDFLRAEAALAWGSSFGVDSELYKQGIEMSFQENGITASVDSYMSSRLAPTGYSVSGSYACTYSAPCSTTAQYTGSDEQRLEKIMIQKWIALYPNGHEAWTEWRRTGYPALHVVDVNRGQSQGVTDASKGVRRMIYPISFTQSADGMELYNSALQLLGGEDKSSTRLWWDCK